MKKVKNMKIKNGTQLSLENLEATPLTYGAIILKKRNLSKF